MSAPKHNRSKSPAAKPTPDVAAASGIKQPAGSWLTATKWPGRILMAIAFLLYANTLSYEYTLDDAIVITDNMYTQEGLAGIPGILKYDTFKGFFKTEGKDKLVSGGRYRPLSVITFALEWALFAKPKKDANGVILKDKSGNDLYEGSPFMGHLINIVLFALTCLLLYNTLKYLLTISNLPQAATPVAFVAALLFTVHPIHTEAVANIKGRDEIMALLGAVGALFLTLRAVDKNKMTDAIWASVVLFMGMLSKENTITFLGIIPLALYFTSRTSIGAWAGKTYPLVAAVVAFLVVRGSILGWSLGEEPMELMNNPFVKLEGSQYVPFDFGEKLATIIYTLGLYVWLILFPHPLTHDYYPRHVEIMSFSSPYVLLSLLLYAGMIGYAIYGLKKKSIDAFGLWWYLLSLSIVSNLVFPVGTNMSERFVFMPSAGIMLALSWWWYKALYAPGKSAAAWALVALLAIPYSIKTILRNGAWKDNYTLFTTDVQVSGRSAKLLNAVAGESTRMARNITDTAASRIEFTKIKNWLNTALQIHPTYENAWLQLGNTEVYLGNYEQGIAHYRKVLQMDPEDKDARNNLGIALMVAGKRAGETNQLGKALSYLLEARQYKQNDYELWRLLGISYSMSRQHSEAIAAFGEACKIQPNLADAWWNLANAYYFAGQIPKSEEFRKKAMALDPTVANRLRNG